jgi:hypothetical protein
VLNPSFEILDSCISNCQNQAIYGTQYLQFWDSPTLNDTPDVMAICNNPPPDSPYNCFFTSAPLNWQGYQYARTGENYMGYFYGVKYYNSNNFSNTLREYLLAKTNSALTQNMKYCFSFHIALGSGLWLKYVQGLDSNYFQTLSVDKIGVKFFSEKPHFDTYNAVVLAADLIMRPDSAQLFSDTLNWIKSTSPYIASGGEQYIMIGNLFEGNDIQYEFNSNLDDSLYNQFEGTICYHYIDDVELIEIPDIIVSSSDSAIFEGESVILSANQIAEEQVWFAEDTTVAIGAGLTLEVSPTVSSTYYLRSLQCKLYSWDTVFVKVRQPLPPPFEPLKLFISNTISKENFLINYTGDERPPLTMALFNSIGQLVYVQNITESTAIAISGYAPGIYYCRIFKNSESILTEKVVVMK